MFGVVRLSGTDHAGAAAATEIPAAEPSALAPLVVRTVHEIDPDLPVYNIRSMEDRLAQSLAKQRVLMWLLNFFGATALTLATVGLYGVLSFAVATHTRELGIRKALGAQRRDLYGLVMRGAAAVTVVGVAVGVIAALWALRALDSLVFGVDTRDPVAFAVAIAIVLCVALAASLLPARSAALVDPMEALRQD